MRFIARQEEIQAIVDILESDDFANADDMAKALILAIVDVLWFRDWYALVVNADEHAVAFGPFAGEDEARRAGMRWQGVLVPTDPLKWGVVPIRGLGGTATERAGGGFGYCSTEGCGHPAYAHSMAGSARGHCVICGRERCERYEQAKVTRKPRKKTAA